MKNKKEITDIIWEYEYYSNGFQHLCGRDVSVKNLRPARDTERDNAKGYKATIILKDLEEKRTERFDDCFYPDKMFEKAVRK